MHQSKMKEKSRTKSPFSFSWHYGKWVVKIQN